jgi:hypothetical protein
MMDPFNFLTGFLINFFILSLICGETHGWGWYNYTEATVYTNYLDGPVQNPEGKWTDYCGIGDNYCFGLYCDEGQYLDQDFKCEHSGIDILSTSTNTGYVFFHDDSPNYTITTKSQEYFKELKARVNRNDSTVYIREIENYMISYYLLDFNRYRIAPFTFESNTMMFQAFNDAYEFVLVDYHCSLVYIRLMINV